MSDSSATYTVAVAADLPDNGSETVYFYLMTDSAVSTVDEVFPKRQEYKLTLSAAGVGSIRLPVADNTGATAWTWHIYLPNHSRISCSISYTAGTQQLADIVDGGTAL